MNRRTLLQRAGVAGAALLTNAALVTAKAPNKVLTDGKIRGVNLGSWLALEKWITPGVFAGVQADDEYTLCQSLGKAKATERLKKHRETWITSDDFKWMAAHGLNAVPLPVGYGVVEENPPYIFGMETVDRAFQMAKAHGMSVLIDLHGVPGSQNGFDNSGKQGQLGWHTNPDNIAHSLRIVEKLAAHCKRYDNLLGLELLNEPRWDVPIDIIKSFYKDAYPLVRKHLGNERAIIIHDGFRPLEWGGFMQSPEYKNVILDTHIYQCFTEADKKRDMPAQIKMALERPAELAKVQMQLPTIVGEWSCGIPPESQQGLKGFAKETSVRAYADAQLLSYETTRGWFFWTYKLESAGGWNFRDGVQQGWLPSRYDII